MMNHSFLMAALNTIVIAVVVVSCGDGETGEKLFPSVEECEAQLGRYFNYVDNNFSPSEDYTTVWKQVSAIDLDEFRRQFEIFSLARCGSRILFNSPNNPLSDYYFDVYSTGLPLYIFLKEVRSENSRIPKDEIPRMTVFRFNLFMEEIEKVKARKTQIK